MEFRITVDLANKEIKYILHSVFGLSRASVSRLKRLEDGILLDMRRVTVRERVAEGQTLTLALEDRPDEENTAILPIDVDVEVLYEDGDCIVVNKPSGMPTHPSHGHHDDTLANALVGRFRKTGTPFVFRPANRLDRETSGVVLVAKNKAAAAALGAAMTGGEIKKSYLALLEGVGMANEGRIEGYVARAKESIIFREFRESGSESEYSLTEWKKLAELDGHTLVEAHPITGRTHQLRVHFSHIGHPISGDGLYGNEEGICGRLALHAHTLAFRLNGGEITVTAPVPDCIKDKTVW